MDKIDLEIYNLVHELAIPPHLMGYHYAKATARFVYDHPKTLYSLTKDVYPVIAKQFNTKPDRVQASIAAAIHRSRADEPTWKRLLGEFASPGMTNMEFFSEMIGAVTSRMMVSSV